MKLRYGEDDAQYEVQTLVEAAHITDPVQNAIHITVYPVERQIEFEGYLQVDSIREFVRPTEAVRLREHALFVLCDVAELEVRVLEE